MDLKNYSQNNEKTFRHTVDPCGTDVLAFIGRILVKCTMLWAAELDSIEIK